MSDVLMHNYNRLDIGFTSGHGVWLRGNDGKEYLDAVSGVAVCVLGHSHPAVTQAIKDQAGTLLHTSNLYQIPLQEQLAATLMKLSGMQRAFFCNSGAEANEAAIKLARLHARTLGLDSPLIIAMEGSFHGRTMGALSATGNAAIRQGFSPLLSGFRHVPYNDLSALEAICKTSNIAAIMLEPILGEAGVVLPDAGYLQGIRDICDNTGALMIADEIQTGICRTGQWFACQHEDVLPDVMTLAKSLANGVPIGACLARGPAAELFAPGTHGSTFGGNPLASCAAIAVLDTLQDGALMARAQALGARLLSGFQQQLGAFEGVRSIRGKGLMIGIELVSPCTELMQRALAKQLLINVTAKRIIRLLPPLIISDDEADRLQATVCELLREHLQVR